MTKQPTRHLADRLVGLASMLDGVPDHMLQQVAAGIDRLVMLVADIRAEAHRTNRPTRKDPRT